MLNKNIELVKAVTEFRRALVLYSRKEEAKPELGMVQFPKNCCGPASCLLARYLNELHLGQATYIEADTRDEDGRMLNMHAWLLLNDLIIDVTASQFNSKSTKKISEVIVTKDTNWHGRFNNQIHKPYVGGSDPFLTGYNATWEQVYSEVKNLLLESRKPTYHLKMSLKWVTKLIKSLHRKQSW
ncbi:hypothetical protein IAD21_06403 (plasmid) [Abditibacteriota bacterium]|nr:hypothetical protein IAD21_06403 [Abditibacteriota bacterium]